MTNSKDMIVSSIDQSGMTTVFVAEYDPSDLIPKIDVFASTGFRDWVLKIKDDKTTVNDLAPTTILNRVYKLIKW